ncbi:MAG: VCBS repeat-containing protein, partial [Candidatus Omnitrophica bacterium]|nr:VCBS repeat-containing protein [Candidatus Omnitrophota bacterium]
MIQPPPVGRRVLSAGLGVSLSLLELPVTPFLAWGHPKPAHALLRLEAITDSPDPFSPNGDGRLEETTLSATAAFRPKNPEGVEASGRHAEKTLAHDQKKTLRALQRLTRHIPHRQFLLRLSWTLQSPDTQQFLVTFIQERLLQPPFALQVLPTGAGRVGHFLVTSVSRRWDGRDPQGRLLPDGRYPYTVQAALIVQKQAGLPARARKADEDDEEDLAELLAGASGVGEHLLLLSEVASGTLTLDTTPPALAITTPTAGSFVNASPMTVSGTVDDPAATLALNGIPATVGAGTFTVSGVPLTEGTNTLTASATDQALNVSAASVQVTLDTVPPAISALAPPDGAVLDTARPAIAASFSDATSGIDRASVRLALDGLDVTAQAAITDSTIRFMPAADLTDGPHTIQLQVADQAGNLATAQTTFTVQTVQEPPITPESGFIHGQVFHAVTEQPLADATITVGGIVGALHSGADGRYQFPTPGSGEFALTIDKAGFTSVQRQAAVFATRDVAVEPAFLTPLDPIVTLITAVEGGVATDSSGTFEVTFPPGAAPRDLPVTITPLADERQLPGPMEDGQGHLAAVYFEPRFTTFNTPATLRVRNTLGVPPGTPVNLQLWHEDGQEWQDVDPGRVTVDGQWIEFQIIRFFCWYCLWLGRANAQKAANPNPQQTTTVSTEATDPAKGCEVQGSSTICLHSGGLSETHWLPALRTLGQARTLTFTYRSSAADPSVLLGSDYVLEDQGAPVPTAVPQTTSATISIEGQRVQASFTGTSGPLRQAVLWDGTNARGERLPTGAYPYTVTLSSDYDATLGTTGLPALGRSHLATTLTPRAILVNERDSPFGAGWSLEGLERLWPQPDGTLLVTDGDGSATVFRQGPMPDLVVANASTNDMSLLAGHGDGTFQPAQSVVVGPLAMGLGGEPAGVGVGDFNRDGFGDVAVTLSRTNEVAILLGGGGGTFATPQRIAVENSPSRLVIGDLNEDGHNDLAVANSGVNTVSILLGAGDGTFQPAPTLVVGNNPEALALGRLNADTHLDLVVVNLTAAGGTVFQPSDAAILLGRGDGTFQEVQRPSVGRRPSAGALGDFTGDGVLDLVVSNVLDDTLSLLPGRGDGTMAPLQVVPLPPSPLTAIWPRAIAAGDLNQDGRLDLAIANSGNNTVSVLVGAGDGTFQFAPTVVIGPGPRLNLGLSGVLITDLNHDGRFDVAVAHAGDDSVSVLVGQGPGTFQRPRRFVAGVAPMGLATGEFTDRQGDPDQVFTGLPGDFSELRRHPDGTFTRRLTDGTRILFDAQGRHTATVDRNGLTTRYVSDEQSRLTRVEFPGEASFRLDYNPLNGHLASVTDSAGRTTQVLINGDGNLRRIIQPDGTTRSFTYDAEHHLTSQTDARGFTTDYRYDAFGRVTETLLPEHPVVDPATGTITPQREVRRVTPSEVQGLINTLPEGVGTPTNPAPALRPPPAIFEDGAGHPVRLLTDHFGAPTQLTDALGRVTTVERDVNGLPVKVTRPNGSLVVMRHDAQGHLTLVDQQVVLSPQAVQLIAFQFAYEPRFGQLTRLIDARQDEACPSGCTTRIEHDDQGNPIRI